MIFYSEEKGHYSHMIRIVLAEKDIACEIKEFDPEGKFIKNFVPELIECPSNEIHNPPEETRSSLNYPEMIVDLKSSRLRAIDVFKSIK